MRGGGTSTDESTPPVLSEAEHAAAESILGVAWGEASGISGAEVVWERRHVVRLTGRDGRTAILKRLRTDQPDEDTDRRGFGIELASLTFLDGMPDPIAPRLLGADTTVGILIMEDLPPGHSLADTLLTGDRDDATADLISYATALGSLHAWSMGRITEFESVLARYSPSADPRPWWVNRIESRRAKFLEVVGKLGAATDGVDTEIDEAVAILCGAGHRAFVHADLCPDNVRISAASTRIFDFEGSSIGSPALDAAYLLAPFPSCWCFADVPDSVSAPALDAYFAALAAGGVALTDGLRLDLAAALAGWFAARGNVIEQALADDDDGWGTTTMRPRLVAWTQRFAAFTAATGTFPRLCAVAETLHDRFRSLWPETIVPAYPALAEPGNGPVARIPSWWQPGL
jgi:hypothetical protein